MAGKHVWQYVLLFFCVDKMSVETEKKHIFNYNFAKLLQFKRGTTPSSVAKLLGKPDDKVGRCEWERVGCV